MKAVIYIFIVLFALPFNTFSELQPVKSPDVFESFTLLDEPGKLIRTSTSILGENGWHHFIDEENNQIILSIKPNHTSDIPGKTWVSSGLLNSYGSEANDYQASILADRSAFLTMNRYWRIDNSSISDQGYSIRYYFNDIDIADIKQSANKLNFPEPTVDELTFYAYKGTDTHPFSSDKNIKNESCLIFASQSNRSIVTTNTFHYAEFQVDQLSNAGSAGIQLDLSHKEYWYKGNIQAINKAHVDALSIHTSSDEQLIYTDDTGVFNVQLQGGLKDVHIGFSIDLEDQNFVNVFDVLRLEKHLSGEKIIKDPMVLYAADIDHNNIVDEYDLDILNRWVKGQKEGFSNHAAYTIMSKADWEAIKAGKQFFTPAKSIVLDQIKANIEQDLILIVKGDLDTAEPAARSSKDNSLFLESTTSCGSGEWVTLGLYASFQQEIKGLQFSLNWNPEILQLLEVEDPTNKNNKLDCFNLDQKRKGLLSYLSTDDKKLNKRNGQVLLAELTFKVLDSSPHAKIKFGSYPSEINLINAANENASILLENGIISADPAKQIEIDEIITTTPSCNFPNSGTIQISTINQPELMSDMITWNDGATGFYRKNLSEGLYSFTIEQEGKCTFRSESIDFKVPAKPFLHDTSISQLTCVEGKDASITVDILGGQAPYRYNWSNNVQTAENLNLTAGTYNLQVMDANNCSVEQQFEIHSNGHLGIEYHIKAPSSATSQDGSIKIFVADGIALNKANVSWNTGDKGLLIENISTGIYTVEFTTVNGCQYQKTFEVSHSISSLELKALFKEEDITKGYELAQLSIESPAINTYTLNLIGNKSGSIWSKTVQVQAGINVFYVPIPQHQGDYILQVPKVLSQRFTVK